MIRIWTTIKNRWPPQHRGPTESPSANAERVVYGAIGVGAMERWVLRPERFFLSTPDEDH